MGVGKGVVPPTQPGLTLVSPWGESGHATVASTRTSIDGGVLPAGGGHGGGGGRHVLPPW